MRKAIVTFIIGEKYKAAFNRYFRSGVEAYAKRHQYDLICIEQPLDSFRWATRASGILMQKLLITTQEWSSKYDYIVWLDSDIYITLHAEDIVKGLDTDCVVGTNQSRQINDRMRLYNQVSRGYEQTAKKWYVDRGIDCEYSDVLQSGVMVFQPKKHAGMCQEIYDSVIQNPHYRRHGEDQLFISYELLKRGSLEFISWEFNAVWVLHYNFVGGDKTAAMAKLMFISNFIHYCNLTDAECIFDAEKAYSDLSRKIL